MKAINLVILGALLGCATTRTYYDPGTNKLGPQFQNCYQESLSSKNGVSGAVELQFEITREGQAKDVKITKSSFADGSFHACLVGVVMSAAYDRAKEKTIFTQALNFKAAEIK